MSIEFTIEERGSTRAAAMLHGLALRGGDVRPAAPLFAPVFHADEQRRFALDGPGWKPLRESTLVRKQQQGHGSRTLRASGRLYSALTSASVDARGRDELAFGTDVPYARYHQHGTRHMPARPVIDFSPAARKALVAVLARYVVGL